MQLYFICCPTAHYSFRQPAAADAKKPNAAGRVSSVAEGRGRPGQVVALFSGEQRAAFWR